MRTNRLAVMTSFLVLLLVGARGVAQDPKGPAPTSGDSFPRSEVLKLVEQFDAKVDRVETRLVDALRELQELRAGTRMMMDQFRGGGPIGRVSIGGNESSAIGTLRTLATAQEQFRQQVLVDQDGDGKGEYGWLGELSGFDPTRGRAGTPGEPCRASPFISAVLGAKDTEGRSQKNGYYFQMFLPTAAGRAVSEPAQVRGGGTAKDADHQEVRWACYAWPVERGVSGSRAFFANNAGEVYSTPATVTVYSGKVNCPTAAAALDAASPGRANLDAGVGLSVAGLTAGDANLWLPAGN